jgi:hypothetical protein
MRCIDAYSKTCLKSQDRKILEAHVAGARYTFRFLCDDAGFQSGTCVVALLFVVAAAAAAAAVVVIVFEILN